jgi:hypothetical protein
MYIRTHESQFQKFAVLFSNKAEMSFILKITLDSAQQQSYHIYLARHVTTYLSCSLILYLLQSWHHVGSWHDYYFTMKFNWWLLLLVLKRVIQLMNQVHLHISYYTIMKFKYKIIHSCNWEFSITVKICLNTILKNCRICKRQHNTE